MAIRDTDYIPQKNIPLKSPLAFGGFFLHYLRIRFREEWGTPWIYREDVTNTDLFIVSGNTIENEIRNNRPAIFVNIGPMRVSPVVIGNTAKQEFMYVKKYSYTRADMTMTVNCESSNKGEAHNLGWHTYMAIIGAEDVLRTKYRIANIGPYDLNAPRPAKKDRETYVSTINFSLSYELTWNVTAVQTKLKEIDLTLDIDVDRDPTKFLTHIYLSSLGTIDTDLDF